MERKEVREEYKKKVCKKLREAKITVGEETSVNVVFNVFKEVVTTEAQELVGYRVCKDKVKGSACWSCGREEKGIQENVREIYQKK